MGLGKASLLREVGGVAARREFKYNFVKNINNEHRKE